MDITKPGYIGPCSVTWKGIDLGHTLEGVTLSVDRSFEDVTVDKYGSMPIDKVLTGTMLYVKFKLAQKQWRSLDAALPEGSSFDGTSANDRIDIGTDAGYNLRQDAGTLVIHPLQHNDEVAGSAAYYQDDINLYKAVSYEAVEVPYKIDEQWVVEITMCALVDESYGNGRRLGHIGPAAVS